MKRTKKPIRQVEHSFAIVVDGETESWYLQMLLRNERHIRVHIKPEIPHKKSICDQYKLVCDLSQKEFTKVFWIIDLDTLIKEEKERRKAKKSPLIELQEYRQKLSIENTNVVVIINNPCLEFWFLLHFESTSKYYETCSSAEMQLKKYIPSYEKTKKFFTKEYDDIYLKLKPYLVKAVQHSQSLGKYDSTNYRKAVCEMYAFFLSEELKTYFQQT